ncbi:MAG TPA: PilN domain-containing protein [Solirubrobacteraceae bacterium]|jgi:Tfp pilus assembly protein PilN|nr:PilN domain-containing protein [Solirubrobacteraceae bacterium]
MKAVNLIPSDQRRGAGGVTGRSDGIAYVILGLLTGVVVLAAMWGIADHDVGNRQGAIAGAKAKAVQLQAQASALAPYTSFQTASHSRQQTVAEIAQARFDWAHTMHEVGRVLPSDVDLTSFNGTGGPAPGSAATSAPSGSTTAPTLTLAGCTTSQAVVAETMTRLRLMDGVSDVSIGTTSAARPIASGNPASAGSTACPHSVSFSLTVTYDAAGVPVAASTGGAK